jgi:glycosyltransferase involved in cell wall biosynthesis
MTKLSVVLITFNEEKNIARCLESVISIADEVLVVDSFSTDETEEICKGYPVRFVTNTFEGHIQQKNYAASIAAYDFILSLDADEALSEELLGEVKKVKEKLTADGYYFNRLNNYCGKWIRHCGWYPDQKLRLWDRRKGKWGGENPHDRFELKPGSKIEYLKGDLLHYSYSSIQDHIAQANKFSSIGASSAILKGRKSNLLKVVLFPFWRFLKNYFIRLGFLDGYYGLVVCLIISHENFLKYAKMIELQKLKKSIN